MLIKEIQTCTSEAFKLPFKRRTGFLSDAQHCHRCVCVRTVTFIYNRNKTSQTVTYPYLRNVTCFKKLITVQMWILQPTYVSGFACCSTAHSQTVKGKEGLRPRALGVDRTCRPQDSLFTLPGHKPGILPVLTCWDVDVRYLCAGKQRDAEAALTC